MAWSSRKQERQLQRKQVKLKKKLFYEKRPKEGVSKINQTASARMKPKTDSISKFASRNPSLYERLVEERLLPDEGSTTNDDYLTDLGKKLGVKNGKLPKERIGDGLDELLDSLGGVHSEDYSNSESSETQDSDEDGDNRNDSDYESDKEFSDLSNFESDYEKFEEDYSDPPESLKKSIKKTETIQTKKQKKSFLYGPEASTDFHTKFSEDSMELDEEALQTTKILRGHLNKLSEANFERIFTSVEAVFTEKKRHYVRLKLTDLILESVTNHPNLIDSFVIPYGALVYLISCCVSIEFGACLLQRLVEFLLKDGFTNERSCLNLMSLLCQLYNFQLTSCTLMYDLIRLLISDLNECRIEALLKIIKTSGYQLRKDDPSALKSIAQMVAEKALSMQNKSTRCKFMLDALSELKSNKAAELNSEFVRLKKTVRFILEKKAAMAMEPFRISLGDIQSVETKGKWWLIGATWKGNEQKAAVLSSRSKESEISKLAAAMRLTTDIRKSIFTALLQSEDYLDAFERICLLKLNSKQQHEIARVILHCCAQENNFNPFYSLVAEKLCSCSHSHKISFQFSLWDLFKNFDSFSSRKITNLAKFYGILVAKEALPISILKAFPFESQAANNRLFADFFLTEICECSTEILERIFAVLGEKEDLVVLKQGLRISIGLLESGTSDIMRSKLKRLKNLLG